MLSRVYVGERADKSLSMLKGRTGLLPTLLCRIGFCLSLADPSVPDPTLYTSDGNAREFNLPTLTGQYTELFFALLRERLAQDGLDPERNFEAQFKAHLNRGIGYLDIRVKTLEDIADLVAAAQAQDSQPQPGGLHG